MKESSKIFKDNNYITPKTASLEGISKVEFYQYVRELNLYQASRGIYISKDELVDELYINHLRCPKLVVSHDEALYYHGLIGREPIKHTFTIYSGYNIHRLKAQENCHFYMVKKELLNLGRIIVTDYYGNEIPMYDIERTICDLFRNRSSFEIQDFNTAIRTYLSRTDKDLNKLMLYADKFKLGNVVRRYMEVLL